MVNYNSTLTRVSQFDKIKSGFMNNFRKYKRKIIGLILVIIIAIAIYYLYNYFQGKIKTSKIILSIDKLQTNIPSVIPDCEIKAPLDGFNYSVGFSIYFDKFYGENYSYWRHLFHKGTAPPVQTGELINYEYYNILYTGWCDLVNDISEQSPGVWLHPNINNIRFAINTDKKPGTNKSFTFNDEPKGDKGSPIKTDNVLYSDCTNIEYCDIDKIPIKTLTNLVFVVNGKEISIYVNGILSKICVLLGTPVFNKNAMYFNHERSSDGYIKKFKYIPYPITDKQVRNMF